MTLVKFFKEPQSDFGALTFLTKLLSLSFAGCQEAKTCSILAH